MATTHESFGRSAGVAAYLDLVLGEPELKDFPVAVIARKAARLSIENSRLPEVKRLNKPAVAQAIFNGITDYTFNSFNSETWWGK